MKTKLLVFVYLLISSLTIFSLEGGKPVWLLMDEGAAAVESGELGIAAYIFREVLKEQNNNPEALKWLGYIFEKEGEFPIAIKQYEKALENRKNLNILEDRYYILYHLADLYRETGSTEEYLDTLARIINDTPSEKIDSAQAEAMVRLLEMKGLDTFFDLYRPEGIITLKAHRLLAGEYFSMKKYNASLLHLVFSLGVPVTNAVEELKKIDPEYTFSGNSGSGNFEKLIQMVLKNNRLKTYFRDVNFFSSLLTTGMCLYEAGFRERGMEILSLVYTYSPDNTTRNKAAGFYTEMP